MWRSYIGPRVSDTEFLSHREVWLLTWKTLTEPGSTEKFDSVFTFPQKVNSQWKEEQVLPEGTKQEMTGTDSAGEMATCLVFPSGPSTKKDKHKRFCGHWGFAFVFVIVVLETTTELCKVHYSCLECHNVYPILNEGLIQISREINLLNKRVSVIIRSPVKETMCSISLY